MTKLIKLILATAYWIYLRLSGNKHRKLILYYHGVLEAQRESFRGQVEFIARRCAVVPLNEITNAQVNDKPVLAITFDDAFANLLVNAIPTLREYLLPATIFTPVGNLNAMPQWEMDESNPDKTQWIMTADQVRELSEMGVGIGSHTLTHLHLTRLSGEALEEQLIGSKKSLELIIGKPVEAISYPYGDFDSLILKRAQKVGYQQGYTIEPRGVKMQDDPMALPRFVVLPTDSLFKLKLIISGAWEVDYYLRKVKKTILALLKS